MYIPSDHNIALESLREWSEESLSPLKSLGPSKGRCSIVFCTSLRSPEDWSQDACLITTEVARDHKVVSVTLGTACREALAINWLLVGRRGSGTCLIIPFVDRLYHQHHSLSWNVVFILQVGMIVAGVCCYYYVSRQEQCFIIINRKSNLILRDDV